MFLLSIFQWWYTIGWAERWRRIFAKTAEQAEWFSLGTILMTLFKPWKQITTLQPNSSFGHRFVDSLVSRFVGFWARLIVMVFGVVYIVLSLLVNVSLAVTWPVIPLMPIVFLVIGVTSR